MDCKSFVRKRPFQNGLTRLSAGGFPSRGGRFVGALPWTGVQLGKRPTSKKTRETMTSSTVTNARVCRFCGADSSRKQAKFSKPEHGTWAALRETFAAIRSEFVVRGSHGAHVSYVLSTRRASRLRRVRARPSSRRQALRETSESDLGVRARGSPRRSRSDHDARDPRRVGSEERARPAAGAMDVPRVSPSENGIATRARSDL